MKKIIIVSSLIISGCVLSIGGGADDTRSAYDRCVDQALNETFSSDKIRLLQECNKIPKGSSKTDKETPNVPKVDK